MKTIFAGTIADFQRQSQFHEYGSGRSQLLSLDPDPDKVSASMIESNRFFLWSRMRQVGHSDTDPVFSKMLDDPDPDSVDLWPDKSANRVVRKSLFDSGRALFSTKSFLWGMYLIRYWVFSGSEIKLSMGIHWVLLQGRGTVGSWLRVIIRSRGVQGVDVVDV